MPQIASGLIGQSDWEAGYGFIYVNLDRWANSAIDNAPKSVQVQLTNASKYTILKRNNSINLKWAIDHLIIIFIN